MKNLNNLITIFGVTFFCISCSVLAKSESEKQIIDGSVYIKCIDPRPQICTREYIPVCAIKNTDVECVTTPCPTTENNTHATGCTACADPKVIKYKQGKCE